MLTMTTGGSIDLQQELEAEEARGFELPKRALLHQRIRYFTDGLALGSGESIDEVFRRKKRTLGVRRKVGPRVPRMNGIGGLRTLKNLRGEGLGRREPLFLKSKPTSPLPAFVRRGRLPIPQALGWWDCSP
jgi:hypothetical protein